jgi:2,4-dienoyl-CoA reductase (NADPH2)
LVNPYACYETELLPQTLKTSKKLAVVGAGPAGISFSLAASSRGHKVVLFDKANELGGQLNIAKQIPGKEEFHETIRYYKTQLALSKVDVRLGVEVHAKDLSDFDEVILATGAVPRKPGIDGENHPKVLSYLDVLKDKKYVGKRVAIVGAGGIGFDVAEYLTQEGESLTLHPEEWLKEWGVDQQFLRPGALLENPVIQPSPREVYLLQRKASKVGAGLGKTTGWIHRQGLKNKNVKMLSGVTYEKIDDQGLHISVNGKKQLLEVDHVILCAGQDSLNKLKSELTLPVHMIGGAHLAVELDAKRAIRQGTELGLKI